jgi:alpha-L-fucosidase 2
LHARGGFEVADLRWASGTLTRLTVRSALGGTVRLRVPKGLRLAKGPALVPATGPSPNAFYQQSSYFEHPASSPAPAVAGLWDEYDLATKPGRSYTLEWSR